MYGIIHKKIFDSTIIAEGHEVAYVFMAMIALADDEDICDMSLSALALRINMPLAKVELMKIPNLKVLTGKELSH